MSTIPEPPPHVLANYKLNHELECERRNELNRFQRKRANSSTAFKRLRGPGEREEFFADLSEANAALESLIKPAAPQEQTYEDVICSWGGRMGGESQLARGHHAARATGSTDHGVLKQT